MNKFFWLFILLAYTQANAQCESIKIRKNSIHFYKITEYTQIRIDKFDSKVTTTPSKSVSSGPSCFGFTVYPDSKAQYLIIEREEEPTKNAKGQYMQAYEMYKDKKIKVVGVICPDNGKNGKVRYSLFVTDSKDNLLCLRDKESKEYSQDVLRSLVPVSD